MTSGAKCGGWRHGGPTGGRPQSVRSRETVGRHELEKEKFFINLQVNSMEPIGGIDPLFFLVKE